MTLRLNGSSSGYTEIDAPAVAGNNNLKLPGGNGSDGNILGTDGAGNLSWVNGRMVLETAKASTSGTFVDFTGIPSWVKRVTVAFQTVSTNGASIVQIRLGTSGGVLASGYVGAVDSSSNGVLAQNVSTGLALTRAGGADSTYTINGTATFMLIGSNVWAGNSTTANGNAAIMNYSACSVALPGALDRVRITTVNGTDTFDAGSINILYEG